jgi:hypothetical protein
MGRGTHSNHETNRGGMMYGGRGRKARLSQPRVPGMALLDRIVLAVNHDQPGHAAELALRYLAQLKPVGKYTKTHDLWDALAACNLPPRDAAWIDVDQVLTVACVTGTDIECHALRIPEVVFGFLTDPDHGLGIALEPRLFADYHRDDFTMIPHLLQIHPEQSDHLQFLNHTALKALTVESYTESSVRYMAIQLGLHRAKVVQLLLGEDKSWPEEASNQGLAKEAMVVLQLPNATYSDVKQRMAGLLNAQASYRPS